jgi:LuxR family maltose regulon positive regulatory protein
LSDPDAPPLVAVVAPAGYGKTTLLREWAELDERPIAWVTLDRRHNDATRFVSSVGRALNETAGLDSESPFVLVLDNLHALRSGAAIAALGTLVSGLPPNAKLVLASRRQPPLPVARMRTQQLIGEIGARELAMTRLELSTLLRHAGHELDRDGIETLLHRTEGWPAGVALGVVYLQQQGALHRFDGADRLVAEYMHDEVLADLPAESFRFLVGTSVADVLIAPLCDALLQRAGSARILAELAADGLVVPLDRTDHRYRCPRLLSAVLRRELRRAEPDLEHLLHRRASAWHRQTGDVDLALHHALLADDVAEAADIVSSNVASAVGEGRSAAVERWLRRFSPNQIAAYPNLALVAAGCELASGHGHPARHWTSAAAAHADTLDSGSGVDAGVAVLRAALTADGPATMRDGAERASAIQPDDGPWRSLSCLVGGAARHLAGARGEAEIHLEEGALRAAVVMPGVHALCLAELAVLAVDHDDWEGAEALITRARAQVDRYALGDHATTALVFAVSALVRARRGRVERAQRDLEHGAQLQARLTDFAPWYDAEVHLLLGRAALRLSEVNRARVHLAQAGRLLRRIPDAVVLHEWMDEACGQLDAFIASAGAAPGSLTAAELRILRFLPTHFSFREIAERTYVSANTVKSQANAVYRKFDVSSRSDAVAQARACGLLEGADVSAPAEAVAQ